MQLTEDSFRALARSSPWRFSSLHFTRHADEGAVEAWLRRPGWLRVVLPGGSEQVVTGVPYSSTTLSAAVSLDDGEADETPLVSPEVETGPTFRPDGLVERRPDDWVFQHADPMFDNYRWVAMLDPVELASGTVIDALVDDQRHGRPVWRARIRAVEGYDPVCGCCPLLWSTASDAVEHEAGGPPPLASDAYPTAYDVALDVATGVVVSIRARGGDRSDLDFEVEIHEVT